MAYYYHEKTSIFNITDLASRVKDLEEKVKTEAEYLRVLAIDMHECNNVVRSRI